MEKLIEEAKQQVEYYTRLRAWLLADQEKRGFLLKEQKTDLVLWLLGEADKDKMLDVGRGLLHYLREYLTHEQPRPGYVSLIGRYSQAWQLLPLAYRERWPVVEEHLAAWHKKAGALVNPEVKLDSLGAYYSWASISHFLEYQMRPHAEIVRYETMRSQHLSQLGEL